MNMTIIDRKLYRSVLLLAVTLLVGGTYAARASAPGKDAKAKSHYYYTAAQRYEAGGERDAALHLYKKAYETDTTNVNASYRYGRLRMQVVNSALQSKEELLRSASMMRKYVDAYPDDSEESTYYGFISGALGNMDETERVLNRTFERDHTQTNALLYLSEAYAGNEDYLKAAEALTRYEAKEGKNYNISLRKIGLFINAGDTVGAIREADNLLATNPRDVSYQVLKGNLYDAISLPDSAVVYYLKAETIDPEASAPKLALADYYRTSGDSVAYDNKIYELLLSEDFDLDEKADLLGQYLQILINDKNDTSRGDYLFSVLSEQYPHESRLLDLSARYSSAKGDYRKAEEQISYALDMTPDNAVMWGQLMSYQAADKRYADALKTYARARESITPDVSLKSLYMVIANQADMYPEAIAMTREMIADIDSTLRTDTLITIYDVRRDIRLDDLNRLSSLMATLGDMYHQSGANDKAFICYDNAVELDPDNHMAYNNHAYFLTIDGGDLGKAEELVRKALKGEDEKNPTFLDTLAWIQYLKREYDAALETQTKAVEIMEEEESQSPEIYSHYGDILLKNDKPQEAAAAYRKALDNEPEDAAEVQKKLDELVKQGFTGQENSETEKENDAVTE